MSPRVLVPIGWLLWTLLLLGLLAMGVRVLTERAHSPEAGRGLGLGLVVLLLALLAALGVAFHWAARKPSLGIQLTLVLAMAYPLGLLIAGPLVKGWKEWRLQRELGRTGDFRDEQARPMAAAITQGDARALQQALAGGTVPTVRDRAGNDLLAWAVISMCDGAGTLDCMRVLLDHGASARAATDAEGRPLIVRLLFSHYRVPAFRDAIALLLDHGAEPDHVDPVTGRTALHHAGDHVDVVRLLVERGADIERLNEYDCPPVVSFTSNRSWASALYLVERGARLDHVSSPGVSLDYYFQEWANGVYGESPAGFLELRDAVARRRSGSR